MGWANHVLAIKGVVVYFPNTHLDLPLLFC